MGIRRFPTKFPLEIVFSYDGEVVFNAAFSPAIAANPFIAFTIIATQSGPVSFTWEGDNGFVQTETRHITVT